MIHLIADKLVEGLVLLPWVDKITGIVKPAKIPVSDVIKTFPIAYNTNPTECLQSELLSFVPDSSKRSIIYFEDFGTRLVKMENQSLYYQSSLRLVVWFNYKKLTPAMTDPSLVALNILKALPVNLGNFDHLIGAQVEIASQLANDVSVFSRYSYQEERNQYVTYPYDYVAFDLRADFSVRGECVDEIEDSIGIC